MKRVEAYKMGQAIPTKGVFLFCKERACPSTGDLRLYLFYEIPVQAREAQTDTSKETIDAVVDYLNKVVGGRYSKQTKTTRDKIRKWLNGGKTLNDFIRVIDIKAEDWLDDPKMRGFLRPETLFGNKFEGYLNSVPTKEMENAPFDELEKLMENIGKDKDDDE